MGNFKVFHQRFHVEVSLNTFMKFNYIQQTQSRMTGCFRKVAGCEYVNKVNVFDRLGLWVCKRRGFFDSSRVLICLPVRDFDSPV